MYLSIYVKEYTHKIYLVNSVLVRFYLYFSFKHGVTGRKTSTRLLV